MKKKKTFEVEYFKKLMNFQLENKNNSQDEKKAFCFALERVLFDSNNYGGYQNLEWLDFCHNGGNVRTKEGYAEKEPYSRWYY